MTIYRSGSRPTRLGGEEAFTGHVQLDPIIGSDPAGLMALNVTFSPGARTFWHKHPNGQTLHVTRGSGFYAERGGTPQPINPGDTVWIPADLEHWHGAGPDTGMTHLAVARTRTDGDTVWLEPVSDADYLRR